MAEYRASTGELPYRPQRWDAERFAMERDRTSGQQVSRYEERDVYRGPPRTSRYRDDGDDYIRDRRYEEREYERDAPRRSNVHVDREVEIEREREYIRSPSPPRRMAGRPSMLRRQSSLDTFDRKPAYPRFVERDEYGPPALRRDYRPEPARLPPSRALGPPERYRESNIEINVNHRDDPPPAPAPARYWEEERMYPERVREREVIRTRRRSRSSSSSSSDSDVTTTTTKSSKYPRKGKTRMPAKLVHKRAIIELGYPFEEEGSIIIIQKALGRENIDEVIQLSEKYKSQETSITNDTTIIHEEKRTETTTWENTPPAPAAPIPAQPVYAPAPPPQPVYATPAPEIIQVAPPSQETQIVKQTTIVNEEPYQHHYRSRSMGPTPRHYYEDQLIVHADPHPHGHPYHDTQLIRRDIRSLAAEAEALRAEKRAEKELRRADIIRGAGFSRAADGEIVIYEGGRDVAEVRRSRKGRMSLVVPSKYR